MASASGAAPKQPAGSDVSEGSQSTSQKADKDCSDTNMSAKTMDISDKMKGIHQPGHDRKPMGLPPIDVKELSNLLRDPSMPQKKILHEVADKVIQSHREDKKSTDEEITGMKGLFDCILEVTLKHAESDNSDDEEEDDQPFHIEFPCVFCKKVFSSSMEMKTHILVLHSNEDPSVLNLRKLMANEGQRISPSHRTKSRDSTKADCDGKEQKSSHPSKGEDAISVGDENVPVSQSQLSQARSQPKPSKIEAKSLSSETSATSGNLNSRLSSKPEAQALEAAKSSIPSDKSEAASKDVQDPVTSSDQSHKETSQLSISSQETQGSESQGTKSGSTCSAESSMSPAEKNPEKASEPAITEAGPENTTAQSTKATEISGSQGSSGKRKAEQEEEAATAQASPAKKGRRSKGEKGKDQQQQDTKQTLRRSSRKR